MTRSGGGGGGGRHHAARIAEGRRGGTEGRTRKSRNGVWLQGRGAGLPTPWKGYEGTRGEGVRDPRRLRRRGDCSAPCQGAVPSLLPLFAAAAAAKAGTLGGGGRTRGKGPVGGGGLRAAKGWGSPPPPKSTTRGAGSERSPAQPRLPALARLSEEGLCFVNRAARIGTAAAAGGGGVSQIDWHLRCGPRGGDW